jgi:hypothetical protein
MSTDMGTLLFGFGLPMGLALFALVSDSINSKYLKK